MNDQARPQEVTLEQDQFLFAKGEESYDLYFILSGKLLICISKGSEVVPLAYLERGAFLGEMSFFDKLPRSAHVVALTKTTLLKIPESYKAANLPNWLLYVAKFFTRQIRLTDEIVQENRIKKKKNQTVTPLTIEQQTHYFNLLKNLKT